MKRLTVTPKVALIFYYCCLSQFRPTCIKKPFSKKRESILSFLLGEFFLDCRIAAKADFCLKLLAFSRAVASSTELAEPNLTLRWRFPNR